MKFILRFSILTLLAAILPAALIAAEAAAESPGTASSWRRPQAAAREQKPQLVPAPQSPVLPPLPEGVEELRFSDFFKLPVGSRGLEHTGRLRSLDGRRVRVFGYMVKEDLTPCNSCPVAATPGKRTRPAWMEFVVPGRMMFTAHPAFVSHAHYGLADDLPPQTVFVTVPDKFGELVPFTPGPMLLTGVLSVGNRPEPDGRISVVRLKLDPPPATASAALHPSLSENVPAVKQTIK